MNEKHSPHLGQQPEMSVALGFVLWSSLRAFVRSLFIWRYFSYFTTGAAAASVPFPGARPPPRARPSGRRAPPAPLPAGGGRFRRQHGGRRGAGLRGAGGRAGRRLAAAQPLLPQQGRGAPGVAGRGRAAGPRRPALRPLPAALRFPAPAVRAAARPPRRLPPHPLRLRLPRRRLLPPAGPAGAPLW